MKLCPRNPSGYNNGLYSSGEISHYITLVLTDLTRLRLIFTANSHREAYAGATPRVCMSI